MGSGVAITGKTIIVSSLSDRTLGAREGQISTPKIHNNKITNHYEVFYLDFFSGRTLQFW